MVDPENGVTGECERELVFDELVPVGMLREARGDRGRVGTCMSLVDL